MSKINENAVRKLGEAITEKNDLLEVIENKRIEIKALKAERKALNKEITALRKQVTKRPPLVVTPDL